MTSGVIAPIRRCKSFPTIDLGPLAWLTAAVHTGTLSTLATDEMDNRSCSEAFWLLMVDVDTQSAWRG